MATPEAVTAIQEKVQTAVAFRQKKLLRRPEWGSVTFENAEPDFDRIFTILAHLKILPLENLPDDAIVNVTARIELPRQGSNLAPSIAA